MQSCFYAQQSCILEFDGASKGNPGQAGAGAVLRAEDGSLVYILPCGLCGVYMLLLFISLSNLAFCIDL